MTVLAKKSSLQKNLTPTWHECGVGDALEKSCAKSIVPSFYWLWKIPLGLAALGYVLTFLIWDSRESIQCSGYIGVISIVSMSLVSGTTAVFIICLGECNRKLLESFAVVCSGFLSLPLLIPAVLSLVGSHAGDHVCRGSMNTYDLEPAVLFEAERPARTPLLNQQEYPMPATKLPCSDNANVGYTLGSGNCK